MQPSFGDSRFELPPGALSIQRLEGSRWGGGAMGFQSGSGVSWFGESSLGNLRRTMERRSAMGLWGKPGSIGRRHRRSRAREGTREASAPLAGRGPTEWDDGSCDSGGKDGRRTQERLSRSQPLQKDHRPATLGTGPQGGAGVGEEIGSGGRRRSCGGEELGTTRQENCAPPIGEEPEVADADEAGREQVEQEAAQELLDREREEALLIAVSGVSPAERDLVIGEGKRGDGWRWRRDACSGPSNRGHAPAPRTVVCSRRPSPGGRVAGGSVRTLSGGQGTEAGRGTRVGPRRRRAVEPRRTCLERRD